MKCKCGKVLKDGKLYCSMECQNKDRYSCGCKNGCDWCQGAPD